VDPGITNPVSFATLRQPKSAVSLSRGWIEDGSGARLRKKRAATELAALLRRNNAPFAAASAAVGLVSVKSGSAAEVQEALRVRARNYTALYKVYGRERVAVDAFKDYLGNKRMIEARRRPFEQPARKLKNSKTASDHPPPPRLRSGLRGSSHRQTTSSWRGASGSRASSPTASRKPSSGVLVASKFSTPMST
jgi:hypothetical protein